MIGRWTISLIFFKNQMLQLFLTSKYHFSLFSFTFFTVFHFNPNHHVNFSKVINFASLLVCYHISRVLIG